MASNSDSKDARGKRPPAIDIQGLKGRFAGMVARSVDSFTAPRFRTRVLTTKLGIPASTLSNWLTGNVFELDGDKHREGKGVHRLFSARDVVLLSAAAQVASIGIPWTVTKAVAETIVTEIISSINGSLQLHVQCFELAVFRRGKDWWVVPRLGAEPPEGAQFRPRQIAGTVFASGEWKQVTGESGVPDAPPVHIVFNLAGFSKQVLAELGIVVVQEGAKSFGRAAAN